MLFTTIQNTMGQQVDDVDAQEIPDLWIWWTKKQSRTQEIESDIFITLKYKGETVYIN